MSPLANADPPAVLVLDGHTGPAVEVLQSLARLGAQVDVAGPETSLAFESRYLRRAFHQPPSDPAVEFISWLRELDDSGGYELIVPSSANALYPFLGLSDGDPLRNKAVLPPSHALKIADDRSRTQALARSLGVSTFPSRLIEWLDDVPPAGHFPVVLTPVTAVVDSAGRLRSFDPVLARNEEQRRALLSYLVRHVPVLEHDWVPGRSWGITLLYAHGKRQWHFAYQRLHELAPGGACSYWRSALAPDEMLRDAARLLDALEWHGAGDVEFVLADDGRCFLAGLRPALPDPLALMIDAGMDLPAALLRVASGGPTPSQPAYRVPHATRALLADDAWIRQHLGQGASIAAVAEMVKAAFPFLVRESWESFDVADLGVTRSILRRLWSEWWGGLEERLEMQSLEEFARDAHERNLKSWLTSGLAPKKILFLCYGNICRSPVAEAVARRDLPDTQVASAGFFAIEGRRSPDNVRWAAGQMGLDLSHWASRLVSDDMVAEADLVFVMDLYNFNDFRTRYRKHVSKVLLLGMFCEPPCPVVTDPYQKGPEETTQVLRLIERAVQNVASRLTADRRSLVTAGTH